MYEPAAETEWAMMGYEAAAALLHRVGETSLAWTAADRALAAAELSGRPGLTAVQAYRLTYVIAGRKHPAEALELAMPASASLERVMRNPDADTLSVYGAPHLAGVHAAAAVRPGHDRDPARPSARDRRPHR